MGAFLVLILMRVWAKKSKHESLEIIDTLFKIAFAMGGIGVVLFLVVFVTKALS